MKLQIYKATMLFLFIPIQLFSQTSSFVTKEYYKSNKIRRSLTLDNNLNVLTENYYRESNSTLIAKVDYKSNNEIKSLFFFQKDGEKLSCTIDFEKGKYYDAINDITLLFKGDFIFHGKQTGEKVISYYQNGLREGPSLQYDSIVTGKALSNKIFLQYSYVFKNGEAYIIGSKQTPIYKDTFSLYKGAYCNFKSGQLNGESNVFFPNSKKKVSALFTNGKVINYSSYDNGGNIITRLKMENDSVSGRAIINGSIQEIERNNLLWFHGLSSVGEIYTRYHPKEFSSSEEPLDVRKYGALYMELPNYGQGEKFSSKYQWNTGQLIKYKMEFDKNFEPAENIVDLRFIFGIPYFYLDRFSFSSYDKDDFFIVRTDAKSNIISGKLIPNSYLVNEKANLKYFRNPFFVSDDYHAAKINFFKQPDEFESSIEKIIIYQKRVKDFVKWLNSSYSYHFIGQNDFFNEGQSFSTVNANSEIEGFIKSYTSSILKNCYMLKSNEKIRPSTFRNPLYKTKLTFEGLGSCSDIFKVATDDSLFVFGVECVAETEETQAIVFYLTDNKNKYKYFIKYLFDFWEYKFDGEGLSKKIKNSEWVFGIRDFDNIIIYQNNYGEEVLRNIEPSLLNSLNQIFERFNDE